MQTTAVPEELLDVQEVAVKLKVHPKKVRQLARDGRLPAMKVGRDWRFDWKAIVTFLVTATSDRYPKASA